MQQVVVNIDAEGNVQVEAQGVRGAGCQQLTRAIEQAIGQTTGDRKKPEFYQASTNAVGGRQQAAGGGSL